jgi:type I restriction enzyme S subunit
MSDFQFNKEYGLTELVSFVGDKIDANKVSLDTYISTDNMLVDRGGVKPATKLPAAAKFNQFKCNDTLFSNIRTYFRKVWLADFEGGASPDVLIFRSKDPEKLDPIYLYFLLSDESFVNHTVLTAKGAKMPRGDKAAIMQFKFFLPDIDKQRKAGNDLLTINKKIELNRQTNQTLEEIVQVIFKSWFVDFEPVKAKAIVKEKDGNELAQSLAAQAIICGVITLDQLQEFENDYRGLEAQLHPLITKRFPNEIGLDYWSPETLQTTAALFPDAFVESELGEIPEGWCVKSLDEIAYYQNGLALQKFRPENENEFLPVLKISQLKKGFADGEEKASPDIKPECIVDNGDVVFSWSGSLMVDVWCGGKVALNQHLFKVTSDNYPKWFYYYWTKYHLEAFQQIAADKAVTMGHIKREHLSQAKCLTPSGNLGNINLLRGLLEKQIEQRVENFTLQELRDSLLPKLLSGELALTENSQTTEAVA